MLKDRKIVLGISGSIAAYKIAHLAGLLKQRGADVRVAMTENACKFIDPVVFDTLTGHRTVTSLFDRNNEDAVPHISLGQKADAILIAPASADLIAKAANGIADDALSSLLVAATCPVLVSPAMNVHMYENRIVQKNLKKLKKAGCRIIDPAFGHLACGVTGKGKMPEPEMLLAELEYAVGCEKDLTGKRILVTAGATREPLDPVRFITNHSSGRMGTELAYAAALRGADVTLVHGNMSVPVPPFVTAVEAGTAREMFEAVKNNCETADAVIMAAAVADYRPVTAETEKIKKKEDTLVLTLEKTDDILKYLGEHRTGGRILCGFAMETENLLANARRKREEKHADLIVANSLREAGAGFGTDTNIVTLISESGEEQLPLLSKAETAQRILDWISAAFDRCGAAEEAAGEESDKTDETGETDETEE